MPGSGRRPDTPNIETLQKRVMAVSGIDIALKFGILPLEVMLSRMTGVPMANGQTPTDPQVAVAIAAAPYIHPRLSAIAYQETKPRSKVDTSRLTPEQRRVILAALRGGLIRPAEPGPPLIESAPPVIPDDPSSTED